MTNRSGYCIVSISPVREEKRDASEMVSQLMFGEIVSIEEISAPWCKIRTYTDNYCGYVDIKHIHFLSEKEVNRWLDGLSYEKHFIRTLNTPWGKQHIYRGSFVPYGASTNFNIGNDHFEFDEDNFDLAFKSPVELVTEYLNTPYLWGGKSPFGIDCSGLTQTVYRFFDINLPRDASQQVEYGTAVTFEDIEAGDMAFFRNNDGKVIHVGILDDKGSIFHASGRVRKDLLTKEGIINIETGEKTHDLHSIRRM
ncbi:MAG: NlpC/P60 family protein [Flavobacteriia bacterium]|jgi:hypothetical protein